MSWRRVARIEDGSEMSTVGIGAQGEFGEDGFMLGCGRDSISAKNGDASARILRCT